MSKANPENLAEAKAAGQEAANRGANCVPAHCSKYRLLIEGFKIGEGAATLALSWIDGWRAERNRIDSATHSPASPERLDMTKLYPFFIYPFFAHDCSYKRLVGK